MNYKEKLSKLLDYPKYANELRAVFPEEYGKAALIAKIIHLNGMKCAIYGAGNMGTSIYLWLKERNIIPDFFIDKEKSGYAFDLKIVSFDEAKYFFEKERYLVLVAFWEEAYELEMIRKRLFLGGAADVCLVSEKDLCLKVGMFWQKAIFNFREDLLQAIDLLEDDESKEAYVEYFRVHMTRDFWRKKEYDFSQKYFPEDIIDLKKIKIFCCLGGYTGDSIINMPNSCCRKIIIFEPQIKYITEMKSNFKLCNLNEKEIVFVNKEAGEKDDWRTASIDKNVKMADLISMDIEGAEFAALQGARNLIINQTPVLALSAYHKADDFSTFIYFIKRCSNDYKFYVRKYRSWRSMPANEIVLYAVPVKYLKCNTL